LEYDKVPFFGQYVSGTIYTYTRKNFFWVGGRVGGSLE